MPYAERTKVSVDQSKTQIEKLVKKYGADAFGAMELDGRVQIVFRLVGRNLMFRVQLPEDEQQQRSMFRALMLTIKGKLESAARGIEAFEEAFLANIVMPDGHTVGDETIPQIEQAYKGHNVPLLPSY
jgi:hypothetical protein